MLSFYRNKWEAYVGLTQKEVSDLLEKILISEHIQFEKSKKPPIYIYDSTHEQIIYNVNDLEFSIIYVSADPLTRFFSTLIDTRKHLKGISYLSITFTPKSKQLLSKILSSFYNQSPIEPWRIVGHPRFQFAILLQFLNQRKWKKICH
ncbi:hypothetical protein [Alkalihalobacillus sp. BA299]|uniref:hypothetical protein n=1 Tax=Alkalihalobacillus sp. BA299 TaxID=2815938 RepID=UPI001ADB1218|nr:hypothetical protein [Alkalihalobacillus sp. BA299]